MFAEVISMKKAVCFVIFAVLFGYTAMAVNASKLEIGEKFDMKNLPSDNRNADNTIIAFIPSLTYHCEYASMLTQSFYYYFDRGMAFELSKKKPTVNISFIVSDDMNAAKSTQNILGRMNVVYDAKDDIFSYYGLQRPESKNNDSTVVLLDSDEKIVHIDGNYRAQGERLKPLENKLKELNGIAVKAADSARSAKPLKLGDRAIDFEISKGRWLSHFRGSVILLSFYPAAFSGAFPKSDVAEHHIAEASASPEPTHGTGATNYVKAATLETKNPIELSFTTDRFKSDLRTNFNLNPTSCFVQIKSIDLEAGGSGRPVKRVVVSSSTPSLLEKWEQTLGTMNIIYANDPDYSISGRYLSYNPTGYNNRVSVIIDEKGRIAYIDDSFEVADEAALNAKIRELTSKK